MTLPPQGARGHMGPQNLSQIFNLEDVDSYGQNLDVLIIEPQNDVRIIISQFLQKKGFGSVRTTRDGISAVNELRKKTADIIIISNSLDGPTATDIILEIREDKNIEKRAVVLLTQPIDKKKFFELIELCVDAIIVKPVILNEVLIKVKSAHANYNKHENLERFFEQAKIELKNNNFEKAEQVYKALLSTNQKTSRSYFGLSKIANLQERYSEALELAKSAISKDEKHAHAHSLVGELLLKDGDVAGALECFQKAIKMSPLNIFRYESITNELMRLEKYDDAISILDVGFTAKLDQPLIYERLGLCYFYKKDYARALRFLRQASERDPENISFLNSLAICYRDSCQFTKSLEIYNQILKKSPNNYAVMFNKSLLFFMMKREEEATRLMERVLSIKPDFKKAIDKLAEWKNKDPTEGN